MTVAQGMKLKNKVAGELGLLKGRVQQFNVAREDETHPMNSAELLTEFSTLQGQLIDLKTKLETATVPVFGKVIRLAELKGNLQFLQVLQTNSNDRKVMETKRVGMDYTEVEVTYTATLKFAELEKQINTIKAEIDVIQEELDTFNHATQLSE